MATNNQNEQEKLQTIPEEELNGVTGGTMTWTDDNGVVHVGVRPEKPRIVP